MGCGVSAPKVLGRTFRVLGVAVHWVVPSAFLESSSTQSRPPRSESRRLRAAPRDI